MDGSTVVRVQGPGELEERERKSTKIKKPVSGIYMQDQLNPTAGCKLKHGHHPLYTSEGL